MADTRWQCTKCGEQRTVWGSTPPPQQNCKMGGYHVWNRLSRFVHRVMDLF